MSHAQTGGGGEALTVALAPDDYFAEVVASQKELDGVKVLEEALDAAVIEELEGPAHLPVSQIESLGAGDAVGVTGD